jgi:hypothetical protein
LKLQLGQRLGKSIGELIMSGNKPNIKTPLQDLISNEVVVNFNVLHTTMEHRIRREVLGTHVVTPQACAARRRYMQFSKKGLNPNELGYCIGHGLVLGLGARA